MIELAKNLKAIRNKRGLTQRQLAAAAETTLATIGLIEIGKRMPSWDLFERLATALNVPPDRLLR